MARSNADGTGQTRRQTRVQEAERQLREHHDQALALLRCMGQFTVVATKEHALRDPDLWCEFTGQPIGAVRGLEWLDAVHPGDRAAVLRAIPPSTSEAPHRETECRIRRHDGVYRHCTLSAVPMPDANGDPRESLVVCTDITDRMHLRPQAVHPVGTARALASQLIAALEAMAGGQLSHEASNQVKLIALLRELAQLTHEREQARIKALELSAANQRRDEFLALATHDLRAPITGSKGYVQVAMRQIDKLALRPGEHRDSSLIAAARRSLERADQSLNRLSRLADRLLDVGRIKLHKLQLLPHSADLVAIVREAVEDLQQAMPEHPIHLALPTAQHIPVFADADRIGQVVSNYLTNAQRYSPSDQPITVTVEMEGGFARVTVRDEGRGIPTAKKQVIWRRFEQAQDKEQQSKRESGQGLGLGLYIAKAIVLGHHGRTGVESKVGHGATFWFTLPVIAQG